MENPEPQSKQPAKWYSIQQAAEYLDVGEPTLYRWMRDGKITYRKVGDSTRFWQEDLDSVMEVFHSEKDASKTRDVCPICHHDDLVEGRVRGAGLVYFVPKKTKFWTLKDSFIETTTRMCMRCGAIAWFGDTGKLDALRAQAEPKNAPAAPSSPKAKS
ncbi:MAG TPA: helix-turn-helix domain-containing protein [Candidatus Acidoferrales bacterium]|nr:helix-turn-helix domain-containing protein [Candidatus Acidoferrales bacterium]